MLGWSSLFGVWERGLSGQISSRGLSHASCQFCCMLGRRAAGTESMCSSLSLSVDVARPASSAFTDLMWETPPRRMVWCEVWAHTDMSVGIMNCRIWWEAEASLTTVPASSIVEPTKLKAFCVSQRQMAYIRASLTSRATSDVSPSKLRI